MTHIYLSYNPLRSPVQNCLPDQIPHSLWILVSYEATRNFGHGFGRYNSFAPLSLVATTDPIELECR